jgi:hypothetical protein
MSADPFESLRDRPAAVTEPLLVDMAALSKLLSLSVRHLRRLDSSRDIPGRVVVGRRVLYQAAAIREWVSIGCPDRAEWEARRTGQRNGRPV